ncbi:MAG: hypothetical protein FWE80_08635 [Oscillospiraceae bacterium]|nr:hypothetical protein [Oscillospiraceae bacterium]
MYKRRTAFTIVIVLCFTLLASCGDPAVSSSGEPEWVPSGPELPDITRLLTKEEAGEAVGAALGDPEVQEFGAAMKFTDRKGQTSVDLLTEEMQRGSFDAIAEAYEDAESIADIGEAAFWSADQNVLLVYQKGYALLIIIDKRGMSSADRLQASRQLAELAAGRL